MTPDHVISEGDVLPDVALVDRERAPNRSSDHRGDPLPARPPPPPSCLTAIAGARVAVRDHLDHLGDALPDVITFADNPARLTAFPAHLDIQFTSPPTSTGPLPPVGYRSLRCGGWSPGTLMMYIGLLRRDDSCTDRRRPRDGSAPTPSSTTTAVSIGCGSHPAQTSTRTSRR